MAGLSSIKVYKVIIKIWLGWNTILKHDKFIFRLRKFSRNLILKTREIEVNRDTDRKGIEIKYLKRLSSNE